LTRRGIGRGDLVAVAMQNVAGWPVVALGIWRADAALVPLNTRWTAAETGRLLALARPRLVIASAQFAPIARDALATARIAADVVAADHAESTGKHAVTEPRPAAGDLAVVPFSSGTGGLPKGVRLTHGNLSAGAAQVAGVYAVAGAFDADAVVLAGAPFFHMMGLGPALCAPLTVGASIVAHAALDAERVLELIAEHRVTHAMLAPPIVEAIAAGTDVERHDTASLRFVVTAGAYVPARVQLRAAERLGCLVRQGYGMTEASPLSAACDRPNDPETVGWLVPGTDARLVDPDSGRDVVHGRPGELWVRGPQVMDGYYGDPAATAATITADGWLRTGDLVTIRSDGQLVIEDRLKDLIKVGGASVAPAELELVLREHPAVRDAAVIGRPHPDHGEAPVAYVALAHVATPRELIRFVNPRVAPHKRLCAVHIVDELARLPSGKLAKRLLGGSGGADDDARGPRAC
jgi:acyl-CoA synthetase (AMP-forming)/AMP-acid ligase II